MLPDNKLGNATLPASKGREPHRVGIFTSHPIQYQAPLFRTLSEHPALDLVVYFASRHGLEVSFDPGFAKSFQWDIPLLDGYDHVFLENRARDGHPAKFTGLNVPGIFEHWRQADFDAYLVMGWKTLAHWQAIAAAMAGEGALILRGESNLNMRPSSKVLERARSILWYPLRRLIYGGIFSRTKAFLTIGERNEEYYRHFGVPDRKLFRAPYGVANERFALPEEDRSRYRNEVRRRLGMSDDSFVFIDVAKLTTKKRPFDLLEAFSRLEKQQSAHLLFVGDGPERAALEERRQALGLQKSVTLAGFVNQAQLPQYYAAADCFVLPSGPLETWGLVVNEAMAAGLPIVASDAVGCVPDLVHDGHNGLVFPYRDIEALARCMRQMIEMEPDQWRVWGKRSRSVVSDFTFSRVADALIDALTNLDCARTDAAG